MPVEERRERHQALLGTIRRTDVHWWCDSFLHLLGQTEAEESGTPWLRL
jgi:trehalose 6-phosphate synthase